MFKVGFVVNPYAGVGGPQALKGSDGNEIRTKALSGEYPLLAANRAKTFLDKLKQLLPCADRIQIVSVNGMMGEESIRNAGLTYTGIPLNVPANSTGEHTREAVRQIEEYGVDLLVFVGGDGTARDVCSAVSAHQVTLGVPAGVKMHSAVFALTPGVAAELVACWVVGELVDVKQQEVRDIDEKAFREGVVKSQFYGEMLTPELGRFMQHVKQGGIEQEELVLIDIADDLIERLPQNTLLIMGPGSTTQAIARNWGVEKTLLGVDLLQNFKLLNADVNAQQLLSHIEAHEGEVYIVASIIGGQGYVIGRGNQQITSQVLKHVGKERFIVVGTKSKLATLEGRPLLIDSSDPELDRQWSGFIPILCGYQHSTLYRLGNG